MRQLAVLQLDARPFDWETRSINTQNYVLRVAVIVITHIARWLNKPGVGDVFRQPTIDLDVAAFNLMRRSRHLRKNPSGNVSCSDMPEVPASIESCARCCQQSSYDNTIPASCDLVNCAADGGSIEDGSMRVFHWRHMQSRSCVGWNNYCPFEGAVGEFPLGSTHERDGEGSDGACHVRRGSR